MPLADNMRQYGNTETMGDYMPASAEHSLKKRTIWEPMGDNTEKMAGTVLKMRSQSETTGDNTGISTEIALKVFCQTHVILMTPLPPSRIGKGSFPRIGKDSFPGIGER